METEQYICKTLLLYIVSNPLGWDGDSTQGKSVIAWEEFLIH